MNQAERRWGQTGLLLGDRASREVGMPTAFQVTQGLKKWLKRERLEALNASWRLQGGGFSDEVIGVLVDSLGSGTGYEGTLRCLEVRFRRLGADSALGREFYGLYSWFVEVAYHFIYLQHILHWEHLQLGLCFLDGIVGMVKKNSPLWVFSLSPDLVVESLAAEYRIPLCSGFGGRSKRYKWRETIDSFTYLRDFSVETITNEQLERSGLSFLSRGARGINLVKLNGSLDVFGFGRGEGVLKLHPKSWSVDGVLVSLRKVNEKLPRLAPDPGSFAGAAPSSRLHVAGPEAHRSSVGGPNEIAFRYARVEREFLRRGLLSGACELDRAERWVLPQRLRESFRLGLSQLETLVCVGYGFEDLDVNMAIRDWLESGEGRWLYMTSEVQGLPSFLRHLSSRITREEARPSDMLDWAGGVVRSPGYQLEKRFASWVPSVKGEASQAQRREFLERARRELGVKKNWLRSFLWPDEVDLSGFGLTEAELVKRWWNVPAAVSSDVFDIYFERRTSRGLR